MANPNWIPEKKKAAPFAQQAADGNHAICGIRLVLVDLRKRVGSPDQQAGRQQSKPGNLFPAACTHHRAVINNGSLE